MNEWKECKLGEYGEVLGGFAFKSEDFSNHGIPVIKIKNVASGKLNFNEVQYYPYEINERLSRFIVKDKDILIAMTGSHVSQPSSMVGKVARYNVNYKSLLNQRVGKIFSKDRLLLDEDFLYYFLIQDEVTIELAVNGSGSGNQANISTEQIKKISILLPPLTEQRSIASVLTSLDDKIDLLHRQNATLEALAETLFRQWFVKEAEESWEETNLYNVVELVGGGTPKTDVEDFWSGEIKWISGKDVTPNHKRFIIDTEKSITALGLSNSSARLLPKYATVISARGTVGNYCLLSESMAFSQSNYGIKPKFKGCFFFTYLLVAFSVKDLQAASYGSVFDTITTSTFKEHKIKIPLEQNVNEIENKVKPYFLKMLSNTQQIRTLTQLRDTLLPKLMSGEVRVSETSNQK